MATQPLPRPAARAAQAVAPTVVLVGNPTVGKSVLFKNLTDHYVTVSNFPGTTVEVARARAAVAGRVVEFVDTPGVNDLAEPSDVARATRDLVARSRGATLVQVADAKNLRRALLLTLQLAELGAPMVLVLNMSDELAERGGRIDAEGLSEILGIPVVRAVAVRGEGTSELLAALPLACPPRLDLLRVRAFRTDYEKNRERLRVAGEILSETYAIAPPLHPPLGVRLGFWAIHPIKGLAVLAAVLLAVFWFVGLFGAGTLVDLVEVAVFQQRINPLAIRAADRLLAFPHSHEVAAVTAELALPLSPAHGVPLAIWERSVAGTGYRLDDGALLTAGQQARRFLHDLLVGEYGALTMGLSYALAIVLPIVTTFFLVFSLLEDSGYLPRMAILVNRLFRLMGLNGRAVLPMILGLGCDTMATVTTRILDTRKERLVTTMLLALAVPARRSSACSSP